jgi:hypothetical protein
MNHRETKRAQNCMGSECQFSGHYYHLHLQHKFDNFYDLMVAMFDYVAHNLSSLSLPLF